METTICPLENVTLYSMRCSVDAVKVTQYKNTVYVCCYCYCFISLNRLLEAKDDLNRSMRNTSSEKIIGDMEVRELRRK